MNPQQLNICIQRHEYTRNKQGLSWFVYLANMVRQGRSMTEITDIATAVKIPRYDLYRLTVALYLRAGNYKAVERCKLRFADCVVQ